MFLITNQQMVVKLLLLTMHLMVIITTLWIAPEDNNRMIIGDDGGAQVTYDGGETWVHIITNQQHNFIVSLLTTLSPYRIYAAQQDNSTIRIKHKVMDHI